MQQLAVAQLLPWIEAINAGGGTPLLVDVREPWEVSLAAIRLPDADTVNLPMGSIPARLAEIDATRPIVCICHHGMRSAQVVAFLQRHGYASVYNLAGGIDAWSAEIDTAVPRY